MERSNEQPEERVPRAADRHCASFVTDFGVSGASISVVSNRGRQSTICSTGRIYARAEALQFELGEGPHWDAIATRAPVMATDLGADGETRWPLYADGVLGLGIRGVFAFPMLIGAALVGIVDLYTLAPLNVDAGFVARAMESSRQAAMVAIDAALLSARHHESPETTMAPALRREVHQATGVVEAQLGVSAQDAFALLQGHALFSGEPIDGIAHDIVVGRLNL